jgi:hypothetical protein
MFKYVVVLSVAFGDAVTEGCKWARDKAAALLGIGVPAAGAGAALAASEASATAVTLPDLGVDVESVVSVMAQGLGAAFMTVVLASAVFIIGRKVWRYLRSIG